MLGWFVVSLPFIALIFVAIRTAVNIPLWDDYDAIGIFLERYVHLHGFLARSWLVLTAQHVQYKLIFMHAVVALQYQIAGHINYEVLQLLGDLTILAVPVVLWFFFARSGRPLSQRVWLFAVPCLLYLSPVYVDTVNWAMSGLQNTAVIPFAVATTFFFTSRRHGYLYIGLGLLMLTIGTSGNGFCLAVVLMLLLALERRYAALFATAAVTLGMAALYAVHYYRVSASGPLPLHIAVGRLVLFDLAFLGAAAGSSFPAIILGLLLLCALLLLWVRGWPRACPGTFAAALFCVVTSFVVALARFHPGYALATQQRYMMYCLLLASLEYLGALRLYAPETIAPGSRWWNSILALSLAAAIICIAADVRAYRVLRLRQQLLISHLILWQRHPDRLVLYPDEKPEDRSAEAIAERLRSQEELQNEIASGLYLPPVSASDPVPVRPHSPATLGIEDEPVPSAQPRR